MFSISKFYIMPAVVSSVSNESAPLSVLLSFLVDFLLLLVVIFICKNCKCGFYEFLEENFGKVVAKIVYSLYAIHFFSKAFIPILEQKSSINLTFYESQPTLLTFMPFYLVAFYVIFKGVTAFSRSVEIMLWLFVGGIIITFSLSVPSGTYSDLLPFFTTFNKVFKGSSYSLIWFGDPVSILFLVEFLEKKKGFKKVALSFFLSAVVTVLLVTVFYAVFGSVAERQYFAPLKMSKYSITLSNIGRLDYFGALLFSAVSVYSLTFPLMLCCVCLNKVIPFKKAFISPLIICVLQGVLTYFFQSDLYMLTTFYIRYVSIFYLATCYLIPTLILIFILIKKLTQRVSLRGANV